MTTTLIDNLQVETDADLIAAIALQEEDRETALAALGELHTRHSGICLTLAIEQERYGVDPETAVSRTFQKVWLRADQFDTGKRRKGVAKENAARNWLTTILKREMQDEIRARANRPEVPLLLDGFGPKKETIHNGNNNPNNDDGVDAAGNEAYDAPDDPNVSSQDEEALKPLSGQREMLEELMAQLTEKERQILILSANYIEPNPPYKCRIPKDELASLATQIGVVPASIKVMRERIHKKLRELSENRPRPTLT